MDPHRKALLYMYMCISLGRHFLYKHPYFILSLSGLSIQCMQPPFLEDILTLNVLKKDVNALMDKGQLTLF